MINEFIKIMVSTSRGDEIDVYIFYSVFVPVVSQVKQTRYTETKKKSCLDKQCSNIQPDFKIGTKNNQYFKKIHIIN